MFSRHALEAPYTVCIFQAVECGISMLLFSWMGRRVALCYTLPGTDTAHVDDPSTLPQIRQALFDEEYRKSNIRFHDPVKMLVLDVFQVLFLADAGVVDDNVDSIIVTKGLSSRIDDQCWSFKGSAVCLNSRGFTAKGKSVCDEFVCELSRRRRVILKSPHDRGVMMSVS